MALATQLATTYDQVHSSVGPDMSNAIKHATNEHDASFNHAGAVRAGDSLPSFSLPDAHGKTVTDTDLLSRGPLLISFYRGNWCPFCNTELKALQEHLPEFEAKGVTMVGISPELPDTSLSTAEQNELKFPVLSDVGNKLARQLGIINEQPEILREKVFVPFGVDWKQRYGDDSLVVPVPASILVDKKGKVRNVFIDPKFQHRLEPSTALEWIDAL